MKKQITVLFVALTFGIGIIGCDQFGLDEAQPSQSVSADEAFTDLAGFEASLTDLYDNLQSVTRYGQFYMLYPSALSDNADFIQGANRYNTVVENAPRTHLTDYGNPYDAINLANNIITKIQDFDDFDSPNPQDVRDRIRGQALALRALNYFDLVRTKAYEPGREVDGFTDGVIARTEPTESPDDADFQARASNQEVYNLIVSDLETATDLVAGKSIPDARMNEAAVEALLARVHLYLENWSQAANRAQNALDANQRLGLAQMMTPDNFQSSWFSAENPEALFELKMTQGQDGAATSSNESLASLAFATDETTFEGGDFRTFNFQVVPSEDYVNTLPDDDARRSIIDTLSTGSAVLGKYNNSVATFTDNIPVIRLSEVHLTRAEALAESSGSVSEDAVDALNTVRTNRGLDAVSTGDFSGPQEFVDEVLLERRRELNYEGHRFFDLKRRARSIPKPQTSLTDEIPYDDFRILAPLPTGEVRSNPQLIQNPGY